MSQHIELNPLNHFTIDTVGEPGNRTFYMQGSHAGESISLVIEKMQATALTESFQSLLREIEVQYPEQVNLDKEPQGNPDMQLVIPIEPLFRVGSLGIGFNEQEIRIVVVAYELVPDEEDPNMVSFWASVDQIRQLVKHTQSVVNRGRPICGNCGDPIDPNGHFCPHRNGYKG